jgi:hypothetical protein
LFGGNLFEIMCNNENFIKVCEYADNHFWAKYIIATTNMLVSMSLYVLAICGKKKFSNKETLILVSSCLINAPIKLFSSIVGLLLDLWHVIIMPSLFTLKTPKRHWRILISLGLLFLFQAISMFVKNLGVKILDQNDGVLINFIYSIDVNLMLLLYYLYSKEKEK